MPIRRVTGGYKWGRRGAVFPTRAGALRQARAAYANGYRKKNPIGDGTLLALGALGAAAAAGIIYYMTKPAAAPQAAAIAGNTDLLTLSPGTQTFNEKVGTSVTLSLPTGASWGASSQSAVPGLTAQTSGSAPLSFTYTAPGVATFAWTDAGNVNQTTAVTFATLA